MDIYNESYNLNGAEQILTAIPTIKRKRRFNTFQERCNCDNYLQNMPQIELALIIAYTHSIEYTGVKFVYCPWCGVILDPIMNTERKEE